MHANRDKMQAHVTCSIQRKCNLLFLRHSSRKDAVADILALVVQKNLYQQRTRMINSAAEAEMGEIRMTKALLEWMSYLRQFALSHLLCINNVGRMRMREVADRGCSPRYAVPARTPVWCATVTNCITFQPLYKGCSNKTMPCTFYSDCLLRQLKLLK